MRSCGMRTEPYFRVLHNLHAAALDSAPARLGFRLGGKIVVEIESAFETWSESLAVQNDGADECRGPVVPLLKKLRDRGVSLGQWNAKVAHSVGAWQQPRQDARM